MSRSWPLVPLGEVAHAMERPEIVIPGKVYRQIGVRLWGQGAYEREPINGSETRYKTLFRVEADDIVVNKIWARNGSVGVAPKSLTGCYGSNEFPTFVPVREKLEPRWFHWFTKTRPFGDQCDEKSRGTSGKNRIRPEKFLEIKIPLPPLSEQRRIVARIDELAAKIEEARSFRQQTPKEIEALLTSYRRTIFGGNPQADWIRLSDYLESIENGKSPATDGRPATVHEWGVLKVGAVSFGSFDERENKALPISFVPPPQLEVKPGDFIMSRANTRELVGACAQVRKTRPKLMLSDKTFRFVFREPRQVIPEYLEQALKSPALRGQIEREASGTSPTMKNISKEKVLALRLPPFPLAEQLRMVAELDALQAQVDTLKKLQAETAAELDALLPSILDRAFKGDLL